MKIIDLLDRIANGEEVPIFEYEGYRYEYDEKLHMFIDLDNEARCKNTIYFCELNDEIEIIEDTPKISKLYINNKWQYNLAPKEDKKIVKLKNDNFGNNKDLDEVDSDIYFIVDKINEIIDVINKGDSNV